MNGGTNRGGAYGYKIKSIADLVYVRSTIPGITFMHILVWLVLDTPDFNNFGQFTNELKDVSTAQKIDIDVLRGSIIELRTQMEKFKSIKLQKAAEKQEETPDKKEIEEPVMPAKQDHTQQRGILEEDLTQLGNISKAQTEIVRTSRARTSRLQKILSSYT